MVVGFRPGNLIGSPTVDHLYHRQDALLGQKVQYPVDSSPAQSRSDAVYMFVHCFGRNMFTQLTDGVEDKLALGRHPVAGLT